MVWHMRSTKDGNIKRHQQSLVQKEMNWVYRLSDRMSKAYKALGKHFTGISVTEAGPGQDESVPVRR